MKDFELIVVEPNDTKEEVYQKFLNHLTKLGIEVKESHENE